MTVSTNGDIIIWNIPVNNNSPYTDTNVAVSIVFSAGTEYVSHTKTKGTYAHAIDNLSGNWVIGNINGKTTETLKVWVRVTDIMQAPFTATSTVVGDLQDPDLSDNEFVQTVEMENCSPAGGGVDDETSCLCIDVAANDTKCTQGVTEWRLDEDSVVNGELQYWETLSGKGGFTIIDPTLPITGKYSLWCVKGEDEFEISCDVDFTIFPQLADKDIFNHTLETFDCGDLSVDDHEALQDMFDMLNPGLFAWTILRNANGDIVSAIQKTCEDARASRTLSVCVDVDCALGGSGLPASVTAELPVGYVPEINDVILVTHPNATSTYIYDGSAWVKDDCDCKYKISQTPDNTLELGDDHAPYLPPATLLNSLDLSLQVNLDDLQLELVSDGVVISFVPLCEITDTCSEIDEDDLQP